MRHAGIAAGRQLTMGQAAQKDGHQLLHDEESRHVHIYYLFSAASYLRMFSRRYHMHLWSKMVSQ